MSGYEQQPPAWPADRPDDVFDGYAKSSAASYVPLVVLAVAALIAGVLFLNQMTLGIGLIAGGCLLAILARIAQAAAYEKRHRTER